MNHLSEVESNDIVCPHVGKKERKYESEKVLSSCFCYCCFLDGCQLPRFVIFLVFSLMINDKRSLLMYIAKKMLQKTFGHWMTITWFQDGKTKYSSISLILF